MPYSTEAKYYHNIVKKKNLFIIKTFITVPIQKTSYQGKFRKAGVLCRVAKLISTGKYKIQSILVPKKRIK